MASVSYYVPTAKRFAKGVTHVVYAGGKEVGHIEASPNQGDGFKRDPRATYIWQYLEVGQSKPVPLYGNLGNVKEAIERKMT